MTPLACDAHPLLDLAVVRLRWPAPLGEMPAPAWLADLVSGPDVPFDEPDAAQLDAIRALLRVGGFKPSGRSKPCNEYLLRARSENAFPRINAAVDLTNVVALRVGIPVSTVDPTRLAGPLRVAIAPAGSSYVFNAGGQTIDLAGLLCLFDADGPAANAVKDAQRAKTTPETVRTLTLVWGTSALRGRAGRAAAWMTCLAERMGAVSEDP